MTTLVAKACGRRNRPALGPVVQQFGPPALIVVMVATAALLSGPILLHDNVPLLEPRLPLLLLLVCWIAFELVMVQLRYGSDREHGEDVVLTEVPLALGLLLATPGDLLIAAVVAGPLTGLVQGRMGMLKLVFNASNRAVEVAVALVLYRALEPSVPLSLQGWAVLAFAVVVTGFLSSVMVALVISVATTRWPGRDGLRSVVLSLPMPGLAATFSLVVVVALDAGPWVAAPVVVFGVALLALLQRLSILTERHDHLISLNGLAQRISSVDTGDAVMAEALEDAAGLLLAREASAQIISSAEGGGSVLQWQWDDEAGSRRSEGLRGADLVPGTAGRASLVVSAPVSAGHELVLGVYGRVRSARAFRDEDRRVLEMIARQAAAQLRTADLIEQLRHDALHDPMTDLPNRRALVQVLQDRMADGLLSEVVLIGLGDFHTVNEALGHDHGDELIREAGSRLRDVAGNGASVGRAGDDEFVVVLPVREGSPRGVETVASLVASLGRPFTLGRVQAVVGASAGVATDLRGDGDEANGVLRRAGIALRHAERTGQSVEHYRAELETATPSRLALAADLQGAVTRGELRLYGQPQIRLSDGAVVGVETLLRWEHPDLGLLTPDAFIPLAVQTGLDRAVTAWVVKAAAKVLAEWQVDQLDLTLSVNVSASALADRHLPDMVEELLNLRQVPAGRLVVELTESDLLASPAAAAANLHRLAGLGVGVSIDDFGTGYSSLSHLRRLPVDEIKIDRSFVMTMLDDLDDAAIVRSVIQLSRELGLRCVGEGVESSAIQTALQRLGCDLAQGYHIARPMPLADIGRWLQARVAIESRSARPVVSEEWNRHPWP